MSETMPMKTGLFHDPAGGVLDSDRSVMAEFSGAKWPVWLRMLTIIGLSAAMWAAIIWALVSLFS